MPREATCTCGATILWIQDQDGKRIPLNKTRVRVYKLADEVGPDRYLRAHQGKDDPFLAHVSHYLSCPDAGKHSRKNP